MTTQDAIKSAIEGGWKFLEDLNITFPNHHFETSDDSVYQIENYFLFEALLSPQFWKALGKSLGWEENDWGKPVAWLYRWHSLIDHLAEGKDIASFFEGL